MFLVPKITCNISKIPGFIASQIEGNIISYTISTVITLQPIIN